MHYSSVYRLCGLLALLGLVPGCGGVDFAGDIRIPHERQHRLESGQVAAGTIQLPADRPFNIHTKKSSQNPGGEGPGRGESNATDDGQAFCQAEAANGGSATAEFHIGHRIHNQTGSAQTASVELTFDIEQSISASAEPAGDTLAAVNLQLVIVDSRKKTLRNIPLVQASSDEAASKADLKEHRTIGDVLFAPGESCDVMLFASVTAGAAEGQKSAARLAVKQLQMRFTFKPAATQAAGG